MIGFNLMQNKTQGTTRAAAGGQSGPGPTTFFQRKYFLNQIKILKTIYFTKQTV